MGDYDTSESVFDNSKYSANERSKFNTLAEHVSCPLYQTMINLNDLPTIRFNILIIGETGIGKKAIIQGLFGKAFDFQNSTIREIYETRKKTTEDIEIKKVLILPLKASIVTVEVHVYEAVGFGDFIDNSEAIRTIEIFLLDQHYKWTSLEVNSYMEEDSNKLDSRVHLMLYMLSPNGVKALDLATLTRCAPLANILPVVAKADCLSNSEREKYLYRTRQMLLDERKLPILLPDTGPGTRTVTDSATAGTDNFATHVALGASCRADLHDPDHQLKKTPSTQVKTSETNKQRSDTTEAETEAEAERERDGDGDESDGSFELEFGHGCFLSSIDPLLFDEHSSAPDSIGTVFCDRASSASKDANVSSNTSRSGKEKDNDGDVSSSGYRSSILAIVCGSEDGERRFNDDFFRLQSWLFKSGKITNLRRETQKISIDLLARSEEIEEEYDYEIYFDEEEKDSNCGLASEEVTRGGEYASAVTMSSSSPDTAASIRAASMVGDKAMQAVQESAKVLTQAAATVEGINRAVTEVQNRSKRLDIALAISAFALAVLATFLF